MNSISLEAAPSCIRTWNFTPHAIISVAGGLGPGTYPHRSPLPGLSMVTRRGGRQRLGEGLVTGWEEAGVIGLLTAMTYAPPLRML